MSEKAEAVKEYIETCHERGIGLDKVVVPAEDFNEVNELGEREGEGLGGSIKVDGVTLVWSETISQPEAVMKFGSSQWL